MGMNPQRFSGRWSVRTRQLAGAWMDECRAHAKWVDDSPTWLHEELGQPNDETDLYQATHTAALLNRYVPWRTAETVAALLRGDEVPQHPAQAWFSRVREPDLDQLDRLAEQSAMKLRDEAELLVNWCALDDAQWQRRWRNVCRERDRLESLRGLWQWRDVAGLTQRQDASAPSWTQSSLDLRWTASAHDPAWARQLGSDDSSSARQFFGGRDSEGERPEHAVMRERIRQIESKALRKLRATSRGVLSQPMPDAALATAPDGPTTMGFMTRATVGRSDRVAAPQSMSAPGDSRLAMALQIIDDRVSRWLETLHRWPKLHDDWLAAAATMDPAGWWTRWAVHEPATPRHVGTR